MKKLKKIMLLILCMFPVMVLASEGDLMELGPVLLMEAFVSIHMSVFVLMPLSQIFAPNNSKKLFWTLFIIRIVVLLFFDFFITTNIAIVDFAAVFIGGFIIVPISTAIANKKNISGGVSYTTSNGETQTIGATTGNQTTQTISTPTSPQTQTSTQGVYEPYIYPSSFAPMYQLDDKAFLEQYIRIELSKIGLDTNTKLLPEEILKRKKVFNIIFSMLLIAFTSLLFFHFNKAIYIGGIIVLIGFFILTRRYNLMKYLIKEIKSRPQEKISNILMNIKTNYQEDDSTKTLILGFIAAIIIPCVLFMNPRTMFEEMEDGNYSLRFYTLGIKQPSKVEIPATYNGKPVVSIRGNVFANLVRVEEIILPDTITEIRGQAFENSKSLKKVKLPSNLVTLGGGAFRNCYSLESIEFPDTTIEIGGEAFLNAYSLQTVKLSKNITEIRGNTFENCSSLKFIEIPDNVTRIGGSAFRNCTSLNGVVISKNSKLQEIGSSAFRVCVSLESIIIPKDVYVNERAFKESPTAIYYYDTINDLN